MKCVRGVPVLNELLYVDDLASACLPLLRSKVECPILNVGSGLCPTVESLGEMIASEIGYSGTLEWVGKPPRRERPRRLRCDRIHDLGWRPTTSLEQGLRRTIQDLRARLHWSGVLGAKQNRARIDTRKSG